MNAQEIIGLLETVQAGSNELDAQITAFLNNAICQEYPPSTDFGPSAKWQFWSEDSKHFLGNESRFPVLNYTCDISAAAMLVLPGWQWTLSFKGEKSFASVTLDFKAQFQSTRHGMVDISTGRIEKFWAKTPALALCGAALQTRIKQDD